MVDFKINHLGVVKMYKYKSIKFLFHEAHGIIFCRMKDSAPKNNQKRPYRELGVFFQWFSLSDNEKEKFEIKGDEMSYEW